MIGADDVRRAAAFCDEALRAHVDRDWSDPVPDLEFTVAGVVAHISIGLLWYAVDLSAGGTDLDPVELDVGAESAPATLVDTLVAAANVVAAVIEVAPPTARGFHPMGAADPSGFAAMACDEMLIHTADATSAFGVDLRPPSELVDQVLQRLFPWVQRGDDPWDGLRWANGRIALPGRPRQPARWAWHCAPLDEWDGSDPET